MMKQPKQTHPANLKGKILLADPGLQDQMFKKSVILVAQHQAAKGASGLILNHPTAQCVGDLLIAEEFSALKQLRVYLGGPVDQHNLTFASFWTHESSRLRYATRISAKRAISSIQQPGAIVRAFAGHSSWVPGQLEEEMDSDSWITTTAHAKILGLSHERTLWADILRTMSPFHKILAETPDDIFIN